MSRKSSVSSTTSTGARSVHDEDPLMRDCYDLRLRLLQTEKSLQKLNPPNFTNGERQQSSRENSRTRRHEEPSSYKGSPPEFLGLEGKRSYSSPNLSPEHIPVLKLSDLTPADTSMSFQERHLRFSNGSGQQRSGRSSLHSTPRLSPIERMPRKDYELDNISVASGDLEGDGLLKKLSRLREENSHLVSQNHKVMTELEHITCELQQSHNKNRMINSDLDNEQSKIATLENRIVNLEAEVASHEDSRRISENHLNDCRRELESKTAELHNLLQSSQSLQMEYKDEIKLRKRLENQLDESMRNVEEMSEIIAEKEAVVKELEHSKTDNKNRLRESLVHCEKERDELIERNELLEAKLKEFMDEMKVLKAEGILHHDSTASIEHENNNLRTTVSRQSQKIGKLEDGCQNNEKLVRENAELNSLIHQQRERIHQYQREMDDTKQQMNRLEELVHRVQEQSMKEKVVAATPSQASDSGVSTGRVHSYSTGSPESNASYLNGETDHINLSGSGGNSTRAVIADLKLKLAMKDAEIQKLQAGVMARAAAQQKHIAGFSEESGGLRSEFSAIVERSRMGDRKQQELEHIIARLEDEASRYSGRIVQLEERLADKMAQNATIEGKLSQRNLKIVDLQKEVEEKNTECGRIQRELQQKLSQLSHVQRQLDDKMSTLGTSAQRLRELEDLTEESGHKINDLERSVEVKTTELKEALQLQDRIKTLHSQQIQELEQQIDKLQVNYEAKNAQIKEVETALSAAKQELNLKSALSSQLDKTRYELETKTTESAQHNVKLQELQEQASTESKRVSHLESSLAQCQKELTVYIQQLEEAKRDYDQKMKGKGVEIARLEKLVDQAQLEVNMKSENTVQLEHTLSERQKMLHESQDRISELEESQNHLQQQVSILEQEIQRQRHSTSEEVGDVEKKLQQAYKELDERSQHVNRLNQTLRELHSDVKESSTHVVELEHMLGQARIQLENKAEQVSSLENSLKDCQSKLAGLSEKHIDLECSLRKKESELRQSQEQTKELDYEMKTTQSEMTDTVKRLKDLEELLQSSRKEAQEKEQKAANLDNLLAANQEELRRKEQEVQDQHEKLTSLDQTLREQEWHLKQRTQQITQLDVSLKEHRSELQQKLIAAEHSLNQCQYELSQKALQTAELKSKLDKAEAQLKQKTTRVEYLEKTVKHQQQELKNELDRCLS